MDVSNFQPASSHSFRPSNKYFDHVTRSLIILDLDETLIYASETPLARQPDFIVGPYVAYIRPFFHDFRAFVRQYFAIAVWTSSSADYAALVVEHLFPEIHLAFSWSRNRCTRRFDYEVGKHAWIKNLSKAKKCGFPLERILVIDDSPAKLQRHYGNLICVRSWHGDPDDTELRDLVPFLAWLHPVENYRTVEKRDWRIKAAQMPGDVS